MQKSKTDIIENSGSVLGVVNGGIKIKLNISETWKKLKKLTQCLKH